VSGLAKRRNARLEIVSPRKIVFVPGKSTVAYAIRRFKLMKPEDVDLVALIVQR
jgi:hypothetical protein